MLHLGVTGQKIHIIFHGREGGPQAFLVVLHCSPLILYSPVSEFIDPVFAKTSPKRSFSIIENYWACFHENWVYKFGHCSGEVFSQGKDVMIDFYAF
jgi:hypothetical protein